MKSSGAKMKLLDMALMAALVAFAAEAGAQAAPTGDTHGHCDADGCRDGKEMLFRVRGPASSGVPEAMRQPAASPEPGLDASAGRYLFDLPRGGTIWVTEDPAPVRPALTMHAPHALPFDGRRIVGPVGFRGSTNYPAFIQRLEIAVYRATDVDRVSPLAVVPVPVGGTLVAAWDGVLTGASSLRAGDGLAYVVSAFGHDGMIDETLAQPLRLVTPAEHARSLQSGVTRDAAGASAPGLGVDRFVLPVQAHAASGPEALRVQNIRISGSRVRVHGRDLPAGAALMLDGVPVPVDGEGRVLVELLEPVGRHRYEVRLQHDGAELAHTLEIDVTGRYRFLVALADVTVSRTEASGGIEPVGAGDRFGDDITREGRLAFYLKRKIRGRYLLTAQADTREREVRDLFDGFLEAYPQDIFRRLDPDLYYPVHGDDSTTHRDVDTQGRLYARLDWDRNRLIWGNFDAGLSGTEFGQYQRSLYGAALDWRSHIATAEGEPRTALKLFGSQAQTVPGHSELLGTGGSLYYLRHTDLLPGSERVVLEVRDRTTGRVEARIELRRGADYEIDALQGRIVLGRPLAQLTREHVRTLTRQAPLDGFEQLLLVDYEYVPTGFRSDERVAGLRARHWFGEHVAVGATRVEERRGGEDYRLDGADLTLQAGRGTWLRLERSDTEATAAPVFWSDNGGLSFLRRNAVAGPRRGQADAVEARVNLQALGWTAREWSAGAWWRDVDAGFSISRFDTAQQILEHGAELFGYVDDRVSVYGRYSHAARGADVLEQGQITGEWRLGDAHRIGAELRRLHERQSGVVSEELLGALSYHRHMSAALELYGIAQASLEQNPAQPRNDLLTLGARYQSAGAGTFGAELSGGSRGHGVQVDAEKRVGDDHSVYAAYRYSTDIVSREGLFDGSHGNGWTLGQRWRLSDRVNLFNEHQALEDPRDSASGLTHTVGGRLGAGPELAPGRDGDGGRTGHVRRPGGSPGLQRVRRTQRCTHPVEQPARVPAGPGCRAARAVGDQQPARASHRRGLAYRRPSAVGRYPRRARRDRRRSVSGS